jgi:hypothetical protein
MGVIETYLAATGLGCVVFALLGSREGREGSHRPQTGSMDRAA